MNKAIIISIDNQGYHFESTGMQDHECIGLLYIYAERLISRLKEAKGTKE